MKLNLLVLAILMCSMLSPVDILLPRQSDNAIFVTMDVCHAGSHFLSADSDSSAFCEFARGLPGHEFSGFYRDVMYICSGVLLADRSYPPPRLL